MFFGLTVMITSFYTGDAGACFGGIIVFIVSTAALGVAATS